MDWNASPKLRIAGRFGYSPYNIQQATLFGPILGGANNASAHGDTIATAVNATYTVSPTLVVDANWGFTRSNQFLAPPSVDKKLGSDLLGIPGTNLGDLPVAGGMPDFTGFGFTGYGYGYTYLHYLDPIFQYTANATWVKGSHNIRFGADVDQQHMNHQETNPTSFGFNGGATSLNGGPGTNTYNQFGDFLLGLPQSEQNSLLTTPYVLLRTWQYSLYVRDQWQVSRKLTLSYGTRWEYYPVPTRGSRGIESFNLNTATITVCGVAGNPRDCNYTVSKRQFSPRIGIAYRPTEKIGDPRGILPESRADQYVPGRHLQLSGAARLRTERTIDLRSDWAVVRGNSRAAPGEYQRRNAANSFRPELRRPRRDSSAEFRSRLHRDVELHAAERPGPRMDGASRDMSAHLRSTSTHGTTSTTGRWAAAARASHCLAWALPAA